MERFVKKGRGGVINDSVCHERHIREINACREIIQNLGLTLYHLTSKWVNLVIQDCSIH